MAAVLAQRTYLKYGFCLSVKSLNASLAFSLSSEDIWSRRRFSRYMMIYSTEDDKMVMQ